MLLLDGVCMRLLWREDGWCYVKEGVAATLLFSESENVGD